MWETLAGFLLAGILVLFFGSIVVWPLIRAPRTKNPQFTRGLALMAAGLEVFVVCSIMEAAMPALVVGGGLVLVGFVLAAAS